MKSTKQLLVVASIVTGVAFGAKSVHAQQVTFNKASKPTTFNYNDYLKVTIKLNDKGDIVKHIQSTLNLHFGAGLAEDGVYGKSTENAVKGIQKKLGISVDGVFGPKTVKALLDYVNNISSNKSNGYNSVSLDTKKNTESKIKEGEKPVLAKEVATTKTSKTTTYEYNDFSKVNIKLNEKGYLVKNIQKTLNLYFGTRIAEDGIYGKGTENAVKSVQKKIGVGVDGVFGPKTAEALLNYVNSNYRASVDTNNGYSPVASDIQKKLVSLGYKLKVNANLNSHDTISAVKQFQKENNLSISGKVDIDLANRLCKDDKVKADETAEFKSDTGYYVLVNSSDSLGRIYQEINNEWKEIKCFDILSGKVNKGDYKSGLQGRIAKFNEVEMRNFTQIDGLNVFYSGEKESKYGLRILDESAKFLSEMPHKTTIKVF